MYERNYHAKVLKADTEVVHKTFPWKRVIIIASIVAVIVGVIFLIRAPQFQVTAVTVEGTNVADPVDVSQFVLERLEGKHFWLLPKTSIFLIAPEDIAHAVQNRFPRFKSVSVDRNGVRGIKVVVQEYPGVYLWCDADEACSFMDETGTVFADAPYFSGSAYIKVYNGVRAPYPFSPVTPSQVALVTHLSEQLTSIEIEPLSFRFEDTRNLIVTFFHHTSHAKIMFDPTTDLDAAYNTLYTGLRTDPLMKLYRDKVSVLEYIDLRFGNKLVYKFN